MNKYILFPIAIFIFSSCYHEESKVSEQQDERPIPPKPPKEIDKNNLIGFACYNSGRKSDPVILFSKFLKEKNYSFIREKLKSKFNAEKYLATVVCTRLEQKKLISLTQSERSEIERNMSGDEKVSICAGCSDEMELTMKELFTSVNFLCEDVDNWLEKMI